MIVIERDAVKNSTFPLYVYLKDELGNSGIPTTLAWSLKDADGDIINDRSAESLTPAAEMLILLQGDDLQMTGSGPESRYVEITGTFSSDLGNDLPIREKVEFMVVE